MQRASNPSSAAERSARLAVAQGEADAVLQLQELLSTLIVAHIGQHCRHTGSIPAAAAFTKSKSKKLCGLLCNGWLRLSGNHLAASELH